jgi:hypothetical protein
VGRVLHDADPDDDEIEGELFAVELRLDQWLDPKRLWLAAKPL